jgi:hypothetical protein
MLELVLELFLGHEVGEFLGTKWEFFFFLLIFDEKKGQQHSGRFIKLSVHNLENPTRELNSSRKNSENGDIIDLKSSFFSRRSRNSQIKYLLIECINSGQTSASRSREVVAFHNWGHNSQSKKYSKSCDHFTFSASNPTLHKLFFGELQSFLIFFKRHVPTPLNNIVIWHSMDKIAVGEEYT